MGWRAAPCWKGGGVAAAMPPSERACGVRCFRQLASLVCTQPCLALLPSSLRPQVQVILKLAAGNGIKKVGGDGQAAGAGPLTAHSLHRGRPKSVDGCPTPPTATCQCTLQTPSCSLPPYRWWLARMPSWPHLPCRRSSAGAACTAASSCPRPTTPAARVRAGCCCAAAACCCCCWICMPRCSARQSPVRLVTSGAPSSAPYLSAPVLPSLPPRCRGGLGHQVQLLQRRARA